ncbi:MAG: hypothetical protein ABEH66_01690 [Halobacteriales archaeon]
MSDDDEEESVDVAYTGDGEDQTDPEPPTESEDTAELGEPAESGEPDETTGIEGESMEPDEILDDPADADDPFAELAAEMGEDAEFDGDAASAFDELDADVDDVDPDELFEEMFVEQEAGGIDAESVWDALEEADEEPQETDAGGDEHVVSAREFCADCEYAAEPPEVRCTYEGSEIVEFVDNDTVRVRNCPVVARRNRLGDAE